jgi:hypothetical protein
MSRALLARVFDGQSQATVGDLQGRRQTSGVTQRAHGEGVSPGGRAVDKKAGYLSIMAGRTVTTVWRTLRESEMNKTTSTTNAANLSALPEAFVDA